MKERTNTARLFELFTKLVQGLSDQEISDLLDGKLKIELKGKKPKTKKREPFSLAEAKEIINKVRECIDRGSAWGMLSTVDRAGLLAVGEVCGVVNRGKISRDRLIESVLGATFDYDQTWKAIENAGKRE